MTARARLSVSPYGLETCGCCDAPSTHAVRSERTGELLPLCADCAAAYRSEFPADPVYALGVGGLEVPE